VADINSREQLAAWLRMQPRGVSRMLAVRWTLRALPMLVLYRAIYCLTLSYLAYGLWQFHGPRLNIRCMEWS
jgi:hypothetical protein